MPGIASIVFLALCIAAYDASVLEFVGDKGQKSNSCHTLNTLAQALYDGEGNILNLVRVFYPPREPGVNFLQVLYDFENDEGEVDGCNVTYIWAKGGFMLIQPPSILQYTSLFFSHNVNMKYKVYLRLPSACRHLVMNISMADSECSCNREEDDLLDMLTHQVSRAILIHTSLGTALNLWKFHRCIFS